VHEAVVPTSVLSADPLPIETTHKETQLSDALADALDKFHAQHPGASVTDDALLADISPRFVDSGRLLPQGIEKPPRPKLRRQAALPIEVLELAGSPKVPPPTEPGPPCASVLLPSPLTDGTWQIRYPGCLDAAARAEVKQRGLHAVPCAEEVGQCFVAP
jgi:hypothetical protein